MGGGGGGGWESGSGVRVDVIEELTFLGKFTKTKLGGGGGGGLGGWVGGGGVGLVVGAGQVGCERRIEVFVKIQKKWWWVRSGSG